MRVRFGLCAVFAASLTATSVPADAHAILIESSPKPGGTIAGPEISIVFRYNSRIDKTLSKLTLTRPDKSVLILAIDPDGPTDELDAKEKLAPGAYSLRWQVLAIDGHITRGDVPFTVTAP